MLGQLDYNGPREIWTTNLWCTNMMVQVDVVARHECVVVVEGGIGTESCYTVRANQFGLNENLLAKFSKGMPVLVDLCKRMLSVTRACMMIPKQRLIVEYKAGAVYFSAQRLLLEKRLCGKCRIKSCKSRIWQLRRKMLMWNAFAGLLAMQMVSWACCSLPVKLS